METKKPYFDLNCGHPLMPWHTLRAITRDVFSQKARNAAERHEICQDIRERYLQLAGQNCLNARSAITNFAASTPDFFNPDFSMTMMRSATDCIRIAAKTLYQQGKRSIGVINPTPKFIHDILRAEGLETKRFDEGCFYGEHAFNDSLFGVDAFFITMPNNPTGAYASKAGFTRLMRFFKQKDMPVMLDFSLRLFAPEMRGWDQYATLQSIETDFIAIEDTGKAFNGDGQKLGMLVLPTTYAAHETAERLASLDGPLSSSRLLTVQMLLQEVLMCRAEELPVYKAVESNRCAFMESTALRGRSYPNFRSACENVVTPAKANIPFIEIAAKHCNEKKLLDGLLSMGIEAQGLRDFYTDHPNIRDHNGIRLSLTRAPEVFNAFVRYAVANDAAFVAGAEKAMFTPPQHRIPFV